MKIKELEKYPKLYARALWLVGAENPKPLSGAFDWSSTREGWAFWHLISVEDFESAQSMEPELFTEEASGVYVATPSHVFRNDGDFGKLVLSTIDTSKETNPKDAVGCDKLPIHLWPMSATAYGCVGLANGMLKYGRTNWREAGVRPSIYVDASIRHIIDWFEGNDTDPDDGVHNLSAALGCIAILVDAMESGKLNDDRNYNGGSWRSARANMEPHIKRLKELHKERFPKHYTIGDNN